MMMNHRVIAETARLFAKGLVDRRRVDDEPQPADDYAALCRVAPPEFVAHLLVELVDLAAGS